MATLITELRDELTKLDAAVKEYEQTRSLDACELICIRSRVASATFEELACWTQTVDVAAQRQLVVILTHAVELLEKELGVGDTAYRYLKRIRERRDRAKEFTLAMLDDRLPPSS
jgi:hypothetical protein